MLFEKLMKKMKDSVPDKNGDLYKRLNSNKITLLMHIVQTE